MKMALRWHPAILWGIVRWTDLESGDNGQDRCLMRWLRHRIEANSNVLSEFQAHKTE